MAELLDDQKREIVEMLACFVSAADIIEHFRLQHGLDLHTRQVGAYDPTRSYYEAGDRWREIFDARRKTYLEDLSDIPIASQAHRLRLLNEGIEAARKAKKWGLMAQLTEQAAKEVGGVLTNERNVKVDDSRGAAARNMTPEDRKAALTEIIHEALEARRAALERLPAAQQVVNQ